MCVVRAKAKINDENNAEIRLRRRLVYTRSTGVTIKIYLSYIYSSTPDKILFVNTKLIYNKNFRVKFYWGVKIHWYNFTEG